MNNFVRNEISKYKLPGSKLTIKSGARIIDDKIVIKDRKNRRMDTQPLDKPSAGSCFRNPEGGFAWKYIDEVGLIGANMNGAEISAKHPNFIINVGGGTGEDYLALALKAQEEVKKKFGVKLIMEVEKFNC